MGIGSVATHVPGNHSDEGYNLPPLKVNKVIVQSDYRPDGQLFFTGLKGIKNRSEVRSATIDERIEALIRIVNEKHANDQVLVWCGLNKESEQAHKALDGSVEVKGSDSIDKKIESIEGWMDGDFRVMVTKPKIAGMGMNFQHAHVMVFLGIDDSWEAYYQAVRRMYRFGQKKPVQVYVIMSDIEQARFDNIKRKEKQANRMSAQLIKNVQQIEKDELAGLVDESFYHAEQEMVIPAWLKSVAMERV